MDLPSFQTRLTVFDRSLSVRAVERSGRREYQILQEIERQIIRKGVYQNQKVKLHVMYTPYLVDKVFEILRRSKMTRFDNVGQFRKEFNLPSA